MSTDEFHGAQVELQPRWERVLAYILAVPSAATLLVMMLYVVANALSRRLLNAPLPNTLEITQYWFMPIIGSIGFLAAQLANQHVSADLFWDRFPPRSRRWLTLGILLVTFVTVIGFAWCGFIEAMDATRHNVHAGFTDIIAWPVYWLVPLSFLGMAVLLVIDMRRTLRRPLSDFLVDEESLHVAQIIEREDQNLETEGQVR